MWSSPPAIVPCSDVEQGRLVEARRRSAVPVGVAAELSAEHRGAGISRFTKVRSLAIALLFLSQGCTALSCTLEDPVRPKLRHVGWLVDHMTPSYITSTTMRTRRQTFSGLGTNLGHSPICATEALRSFASHLSAMSEIIPLYRITPSPQFRIEEEHGMDLEILRDWANQFMEHLLRLSVGHLSLVVALEKSKFEGD